MSEVGGGIPSDEDLLIRLGNFEDSFTERKSKTNIGGWLRTAVAFANSLPIGYPGVLFIGVADSGELQDGLDPETTQKSIVDNFKEKIFPPLPTWVKTLRTKDKPIIAVVILGSDSRPHFVGHPYIRKGNQSVLGSEEEVRALQFRRDSKHGEIARWVGKRVQVAEHKFANAGLYAADFQFTATVLACNPHYLTLREEVPGEPVRCSPLSRVNISFDPQKNTLLLEINEN